MAQVGPGACAAAYVNQVTGSTEGIRRDAQGLYTMQGRAETKQFALMKSTFKRLERKRERQRENELPGRVY